MNELIPINYEGEQPTVSARELYTGLEITDRFSRWFERMSAYGFSEGNDFTSVKSSTLVNNGAEREITDYRVFYRHGETDLYDSAFRKRQTIPTILFRPRESLEHARTDICQSVKNGRPDNSQA